jgi:DNA repair exonuclease SbcCD ATPase subunit
VSNTDKDAKREMFQQAIPVLEYLKLMRDNDFDPEPEIFMERLKSISAHITDENRKDFKYVFDIREELEHINKWIYEYRYEYLHERLEKLWKDIHDLQRLLEKQQSEFDLNKKQESEINNKIIEMIKDVNKSQQNDSIGEIHFWYENTFPLI